METRLLLSVLFLAVIFLLESVFPHVKGRKSRLIHAFPNLVMGSCNGIITGFLFAGLMVNAVSWSTEHHFGLLNTIHLPVSIRIIVAFILFDFWMYLWHLANHRIRFLWRFHRMHHTDLEVDTTTALRFHPVEIIFSSIARLAVVPFLSMNLTQLAAYGIFLQPVILFHHSNVGLPESWDRVLRLCIVTPNMHRVHHSQEWSETNSNYASIFSLWDRLNRTYRERQDTLTISYGLRILREKKWQRLSGMLLTPFK